MIMQEAMSLRQPYCFDRIRGKNIQLGTPEEIISHPKNDFCQKLLKVREGWKKLKTQTIQTTLLKLDYNTASKSWEENMGIVLRTKDTVDQLIIALSKDEYCFSLTTKKEKTVLEKITNQAIECLI